MLLKSIYRVLFCLMLVCLGFDALASESRIQAMGAAGDYMEDSRNTLQWYGTIPAYGDILCLELGTLAQETGSSRLRDSSLGLNLDLGDKGRLGTAGFNLTGSNDANPQGSSAGLHWGIGHHHQFGMMVRFRDAEAASEREPGGYRNLRVERDLTLGAGLRLDLGELTYLDFAGDLTGTDRKLVDDGWLILDDQGNYNTWSCRMRVFRSLGTRLAVVPYWSVTDREQGWLDPQGAFSAALLERDRRVGLGLNYFPDADSMILIAVEYGDISGSLTPTFSILPHSVLTWNSESYTFVIGLESRLRSWVSFRAGARAFYGTREDYPPLTTLADYDPATYGRGYVERGMDLSLGLALHLGRFDLDLVVNSEPIFHLGNILTGDEGSEQANISCVSLTYLF